MKKKTKPDIKLIRRAMKAVSKKGVKIANGTWGVEWDKKKKSFVPDSDAAEEGVCALGALLVYANGDLKYNPTGWLPEYRTAKAAAKYLHVSEEWVSAFIHGFDESDMEDVVDDKWCDPDVTLNLTDGMADFYDSEHDNHYSIPIPPDQLEKMEAWHAGNDLREEFGL